MLPKDNNLVRNLMDKFHVEVVRDLLKNREEYGIESIEEFNKFQETILLNVFFCLKKIEKEKLK